MTASVLCATCGDRVRDDEEHGGHCIGQMIGIVEALSAVCLNPDLRRFGGGAVRITKGTSLDGGEWVRFRIENCDHEDFASFTLRQPDIDLLREYLSDQWGTA